MNEVHVAPARRHFVDGGYALSLLAVAIATGYALLPPGPAAGRPVVYKPPTVAAVASSAILAEPPRPGTPPAEVNTLPALRATDLQPRPTRTPEPPVQHVRLTPQEPRTSPEPRTPQEPRTSPEPRTEQPARPAEIVTPQPPRQPWPERVTGRVVDAVGKPLAGASVVFRGREMRADDEGAFAVATKSGDAPIVVKLPGYERVVLQGSATTDRLDVTLRPKLVKAAYLTYFGIAHGGIRGRVLDIIAKTELNAVVIDIKGDRGWIPYRTEVDVALKVGAQGPIIMRDFDGLMADFKARGIYTIARIVTFKDNVLANARPDLAIIDTRTGRPWIDNEKLAWVDPFREEVWAYNIEIAKEAARKGFDEIQFDYVRFPTDGKLGAARYARPNNKDTRLPTVVAFLSRARRELGAQGVYVGADVFGYTAFNENDTDIGQRIEEIAPHVDYICPMVYPSGYHVGIPGFRNPVAHPYEVVHESVRLIRKRSNGLQVRVRPWLQDFRDYAFDRRVFGVDEIRAQIKGAEEAGAVGFMLWNPRNGYTAAALRPKGPLASR